MTQVIRKFFFFEESMIRNTYSSVFSAKNTNSFSQEDLDKAIHVIAVDDLRPLIEKIKAAHSAGGVQLYSAMMDLVEALESASKN